MLKVNTIRCNEFAENCYIVFDEESREAIIIDPGIKYEEEWQKLSNIISANNLHVVHILITHSHVDHVIGTGRCTKEFDLCLTGSLEDQLSLPSASLQGRLFGIEANYTVAPVKQDVKDGSIIELGSHRIKVIDCPGHSFHGLCYYIADSKLLFSGDVLFYCSIGRADMGEEMGCNMKTLIQSITDKLLTLPSDVEVYPGHGPMTTICFESDNNPFL